MGLILTNRIMGRDPFDSWDISEYETDYEDHKKIINTANNTIAQNTIFYIFSIIAFLLCHYIKYTFLESPPLSEVLENNEDDSQTQYNWLVPGPMNDEVFNMIVDIIAEDALADIDKLVIVTDKKTEARNITQISVVPAHGWVMNMLEKLELFPHSDMREMARKYVVCSTPCRRVRRG